MQRNNKMRRRSGPEQGQGLRMPLAPAPPQLAYRSLNHFPITLGPPGMPPPPIWPHVMQMGFGYGPHPGWGQVMPQFTPFYAAPPPMAAVTAPGPVMAMAQPGLLQAAAAGPVLATAQPAHPVGQGPGAVVDHRHLRGPPSYNPGVDADHQHSQAHSEAPASSAGVHSSNADVSKWSAGTSEMKRRRARSSESSSSCDSPSSDDDEKGPPPCIPLHQAKCTRNGAVVAAPMEAVAPVDDPPEDHEDEAIEISSEEEPDCTICFEDDDPHFCRTECGHTFHWPCLLRWFDEKKICPMCREPIEDPLMKIPK